MTSSATGFQPPTQSFFRDLSNDLPDGNTDVDDSVRRFGGTGFGGASAAEAIPAIAGATAVNSPVHLSASALHRGQLLYGANPLSYYLERALSNVANERIDIGTIVGNPSHAFTLRVHVSVGTGGISQTKIYSIPICYHVTTNVIRSAVPSEQSILAGDTNGFELLLRNNTVTTSLWLRRTAGATATQYRIRIELIGDGTQVFTESAAVAVDAAVYTPINFSTDRAFYAATAVTAANGQAVFALPAGRFAVAPVVTLAMQTADNRAGEVRIIALTATSCTVQATTGNAYANLVGATIHLHATTAG